jgi:predicted CXXCH cytochrome family protein
MSTRKGLVEMSTTSYCLTCHDGAVASPINAHMQTGPSSAAATASLRTRNGSKFAAIAFASLNASRSGDTHPVDLRYPDWNPKFRPLAEVQEKLPLPGGMLTCETCHSGNEASIGNLTISNRGSALCLTCHLK